MKNSCLSGFIILFLFFACSSTKQSTKADEAELTGTYSLTPYHGPKKKVAVTTFINGTRFGKRRLGDNISDILITELSKSGRFILLERSRVDDILDQMALSQSGLTEGTLDQIRLIDADYIITGTVTQYSVNTSGSRGLFTQSKTQTAEVTADVRLINIRSGEIILSEIGTGKAEKTYEKVLGMGESGGYDESLELIAFRKAVVKLTENIVTTLRRHPWICDVVEIAGSSLYINAGRKSNLAIGDRFVIYQREKEIKDRTGRVLGYKEIRVAEGLITELIGEESAVLQVDSKTKLNMPLYCKLRE